MEKGDQPQYAYVIIPTTGPTPTSLRDEEMKLLRGWLSLTALSTAVYASSGDRDPHFQRCLTQCDTEICKSDSQPYVPALALWLTQWSCLDNCKYSCMHWNTDLDIQSGEGIQQYYGKWPFHRYGGMQEPASVAFSLLNLWFHVLGSRKVRRRVPHDHPMKAYYLWWSAININAWFWSAVFHSRGQYPTTRSLVDEEVMSVYQTCHSRRKWIISRPLLPFCMDSITPSFVFSTSIHCDHRTAWFSPNTNRKQIKLFAGCGPPSVPCYFSHTSPIYPFCHDSITRTT